MGTSPAPELASNFTFWHGLEFLLRIVNEHKQSGPSQNPFEFTNQFATRTKRYIDDMFTVSRGHTPGLSLKNVISREGTSADTFNMRTSYPIVGVGERGAYYWSMVTRQGSTHLKLP